MGRARDAFGITLTQNSYGFQLMGFCEELDLLGYKESDLNLDLLANRYPTLTHIFAAGNDQDACQEQIGRIYGQPFYGTGSNRAKNALHVGALDGYGAMTNFSSWGPTDDGRMFPTLCAKGENVLSTVTGNGYSEMSGTSMACPTVSGHAALLSERYAQLHHRDEIPSALLRALLANTATDAGRPGPDFQYGYGVMDAERATIALEQECYAQGEVEQGKTNTLTVKLPKDCAGLRAMLVWNDAAVAKTYKYGERALVNDLDLQLAAGGKTYLPWVCNATKGHLEDPATRKRDSVNNIEQVTLSADELKGLGEVTLTVHGKAVATGKQSYAVVWYFDTDTPRVISPADGMRMVAGEPCLVVVENVEIPYRIELSCDGGQSWTTLGQMSKPYHNFPIRIPASSPLTTSALLRVTDAKGRIAKSTHPFSIAPQVKKLKLEGDNGCGTTGWRLTWVGAEAATEGYAILLANPDDGGEFQTIAEAKAGTTEIVIPSSKLQGIERPILSVAVKMPDGTLGKRAVGVVGNYSVPVRLTANDLPFEETFTKYPSRYFTVRAGNGTAPARDF